MTRPRKTALAFMVFLVAIGGTEFTLRGPLRAANGCDLASPYVSAVRLVHRQNPFSYPNFLADWHAAGAPESLTVDLSGQHPIYPPTAVAILTPLSSLRWPAAVRLYSWGCAAAYLGLVWLLSVHIGGSVRSLKRLGFIAFALGISPVHAGIAQNNPSALVFILCGFALALASRRDTPFSGILLALGFCIKPTSAIAAVLILLLYRRIKSLAVFASVSALIAVGAAIAMSHVPSSWKVDYADNLHMLFGHNGAADFAADNAGRFDLVNLQVPIYTLSRSIPIAEAVAIAVTLILALVWLILFYKERDPRTDSYWLAAGTLSLIALLPVYQRNYNAAVILFLAVWIFHNIQIPYARAALIAGFAFLIPGEAIIRRSPIGDQLASNAVSATLLMSNLTWSIIAVISICCWYRSRIPIRKIA